MNNPYELILHKSGDRTIKEQAKLEASIKNNRNKLFGNSDLKSKDLVVEGYKDEQAYFEKHNTMYLKESATRVRDPHVAQMRDMK